MNRKSEYYFGIDGLRTIAALSIIIMHVAKNANYSINGIIYNNIIWRFESFVNLFFIISGFSMSVAYYDKFRYGKIDLNDFFSKRYVKILPFFSILVICDLLLNWEGLKSAYEGFANLTLLFAFLPASNITVIGVGWTLGVIFAFYCLFPFFVFLLWSKRRAWITFIIMLIMQYLTEFYFLSDGKRILTNILMWFVYFVAGGILYLYRKEIIDKISLHRKLMLVICIISTIFWFFTEHFIGNIYIFTLKTLLICCLWIMYSFSINSKILSNKVTRFISSISLEIYLSHMLIYRIVEKLNLIRIVPNSDIFSYIITCLLVIFGTIIFSIILKKIIEKMNQLMSKVLKKYNYDFEL